MGSSDAIMVGVSICPCVATENMTAAEERMSDIAVSSIVFVK